MRMNNVKQGNKNINAIGRMAGGVDAVKGKASTKRRRGGDWRWRRKGKKKKVTGC